jgi:hypothetical protein
MQSQPSPSVESLRHRSEQSRARLKETISQFNQAVSETSDELKTTLSPDHLKQEVRAYAKQKQTSVARALRTNMTNHPLEALALGAVVAYPLLGVVKRIPIPLVLVGAGLFLSRMGKGSNSEKAAPSGGVFQFATNDEGGSDDKFRSGLKDMPGSLASAGAKAAEALTDMATAAVSDVQSKTGEIAAHATKMSKDSRDTLTNVVQRNPLLAGGAAMALGGFIAASIPSFRIEERVLGRGSEALKDAARQAADGVVRGAKAEAVKVADNVTGAARDAGLKAEAFGQTVDALTEKVAAVVDRGVDAAIGAETQKAGTDDTSDGGQNAKL